MTSKCSSKCLTMQQKIRSNNNKNKCHTCIHNAKNKRIKNVQKYKRANN